MANEAFRQKDALNSSFGAKDIMLSYKLNALVDYNITTFAMIFDELTFTSNFKFHDALRDA
ncbi:hypothetical protein [Anaerobiospirillum succiniciproducens]|uniref:hypothetical protein n=1 Tax=Anaerobiospirillum succiniciproducens TaxID=13335 RepID=UPI003F890104